MTRAPSICAAPDCPDRAVNRGRCTAHRLKALHGRDGSAAGWRKLRAQVLARDHYRCVTCAGTHELEVHHAWPLAEGGTNEPANLLTLCGEHHRDAHRGEQPPAPVGESTAWGHPRGARMSGEHRGVA